MYKLLIVYDCSIHASVELRLKSKKQKSWDQEHQSHVSWQSARLNPSVPKVIHCFVTDYNYYNNNIMIALYHIN